MSTKNCKIYYILVPILLIFSSNAVYGNIAFQNFSEKNEKNLTTVLDNIKNLLPKKLIISPDVYMHNSRFYSLYKFQLNGKELYKWLEKRINIFTYENSWTVATNKGNGVISIGDQFFESKPLEQLYILIHEARHSDGDSYPHIKCPPGVISATQPEMDLTRYPACDNRVDGAYGFQAALLFEIYAYGLFDYQMAGLLYNSTISRIILISGTENN